MRSVSRSFFQLLLIIGIGVCVNPAWGQNIPVDLESLRWSEQKTLTALEAHALSPTIVADEYGLHILYQELRTTSNATVSYMFSPDLGKTWQNQQVLAKAYSMGVGTSLLSRQGQLHAVWCPTERGTNGLNYRRSENGGKTWLREKVLTETKRAIYLPKLYDDQGKMYLTWVEKLVVGTDLVTRAPSVKDLDIRTMTLKDSAQPTVIDETYDCTLNLMTSEDGGQTWSRKLVVERIFEDIRVYNFGASGAQLTFTYRIPGNKYGKIHSRDSGLVWRKEEITEEEFGSFVPPTVVKYKENYFHIGTKPVDNRSVIFLMRTDYVPPTVEIVDEQPVRHNNDFVLRWQGHDDWSAADRLKYQYRFNEVGPEEWVEATELEVSGLDDGPQKLVVRVMDEAGNICEEPAEYEFEVKMPPETQIVTSIPEKMNNPQPRLEWTGEDNTTETNQLRYLISSNGQNWEDLGTAVATTLEPLEDGKHQILVKAVDEAGNEDASPASVEFILDTQMPQTTKVEVGKWVPGVQNLSLNVEARDNLTAGGDLLFSRQINQNPPGDFTALPSVPIAGLGDGEHVVRIRARDEAGNVEDPPAEATFNLEIPPTIEIVSAPLTGLSQAYFELVCEVSDNSTPREKILVTYRINDEEWQEPLAMPIFRVRRKDMEPGRHKLEVKAIDERGNESLPGPKTSIQFVIDPGIPRPPENLRVKAEAGQVLLQWRGPSEAPEGQVFRYNVYRSREGRFGMTLEERQEHLVAGGLVEGRYVDRPPSATDNQPTLFLYAVTLVSPEGRESPFSPMVAIETRPAEGPRAVSLGDEPEDRRQHVVVVAGGLLLVLLMVILVMVMMLRRRGEEEEEE